MEAAKQIKFHALFLEVIIEADNKHKKKKLELFLDNFLKTRTCAYHDTELGNLFLVLPSHPKKEFIMRELVGPEGRIYDYHGYLDENGIFTRIDHNIDTKGKVWKIYGEYKNKYWFFIE